MKKLIYSFPILVASLLNAQVGISKNTIDNSAILDISASTNKGLLIPRVAFKSADLSSTTSPIVSPSEGLLVYNTDDSEVLKGFYIRSNNEWKLLSSNSNKTSDLFIYRTSSGTSFTPSNTYADLSISSLKSNILVNTANAILLLNNNLITLDKGKYILTYTTEITTNETTTIGIANKKVHVHNYKMRVTDSNGNVLPNSTESFTSVNSHADSKTHTLIIKLRFDLDQSTSIKVQLGRNTANSTYTGSITPSNTSLHILKSVKK